MDKEVPFIVYESAMARAERHIKRLTIELMLAIIGLVAINIFWLYMWNSYEYVGESETITFSQDGNGNNVIGEGNSINEPNDNDFEKN